MSHESYDVTLNVSSKESEPDVMQSSILNDAQLIDVNPGIGISSRNTIVHALIAFPLNLNPALTPSTGYPEIMPDLSLMKNLGITLIYRPCTAKVKHLVHTMSLPTSWMSQTLAN